MNSANQSNSNEKSQSIGTRYLSFTLGQEDYAIPLLSVREVIAVPEITPIPFAPPHFVGIMNLRGQVISIIDLRQKLGIKPKAGAETAVIICDLAPLCLGVVVDSINSVLSPNVDEVTEKPQIQSGKNIDYITHVYRQGKKLTLFLDIRKILDAGDHQAVSSVTQVKRAA
ncbi:MAG: chemotaxis protein CheW [Oligoflexia bacterium]|nr:chemotaxis protein CheW [Oligoflexia bacterium]